MYPVPGGPRVVIVTVGMEESLQIILVTEQWVELIGPGAMRIILERVAKEMKIAPLIGEMISSKDSLSAEM